MLSYDVRGALRTPGEYSELYWDVTGSQMDPIGSSRVQVNVPGGVQDLRCFAGRPTSSTPCTSATLGDGTAVFVQDGLATGELLTVAVQIQQEAVTGRWGRPGRVHVQGAELAHRGLADRVDLGRQFAEWGQQ